MHADKVIPLSYLQQKLLSLPTATTSVQDALSDAGLAGVDLDARGVLALPLYAFPDDQMYDHVKSIRSYLASLLPVQ